MFDAQVGSLSGVSKHTANTDRYYAQYAKNCRHSARSYGNLRAEMVAVVNVDDEAECAGTEHSDSDYEVLVAEC